MSQPRMCGLGGPCVVRGSSTDKKGKIMTEKRERRPWQVDPKAWKRDTIRIPVNNKPPGEVCEKIMGLADKLEEPKLVLQYTYGGNTLCLQGWRKPTEKELAEEAAEEARYAKRKAEQQERDKKYAEQRKHEADLYRARKLREEKDAAKRQAESIVAVLREAGYIVVKETKTRKKKETKTDG